MTLEEALEASGAEPVNDIFLINPETRTITVPETEKIFGVSHDGNTERKHFRCPKVVGDNIDLSTMHLYINYQNANGDKYPYLVEDVQTDGGYITFSWLIGPDVVAYKGQVKFIVCAKKGDGAIPEWNTTLAEGTVLEGLEAADDVVARNPDIIEQMLTLLKNVSDEPVFTEARTRENVTNGDKVPVLWGKVKKWFADLGTAAFCKVVNNLTTAAEGGVLDARQGKELNDALAKLNKLIGNTDISDIGNGTVTNALSVLNNNLKNKPTFSISPYKDKTIVAFGDSVLAGWGWKEGTGIIQPLKEKYSDATWINKAESGANMAVTSSPAHAPIVNQITSYTGAADAIILDGGVNDKNNGISIGSITSAYDATYDTSTFCGALESALQYIMDRYPLAVKLYLIPHSFGKDNSYLDPIYEKAIEICKKWNMPCLDMRTYSQIAMTSANKEAYTYNPNSKKGDGVHPNETWYRTFYCPVIDQALQNQGIGSITASEAPEVVAVTGVKLDQTTLALDAGDSAQLTATVQPTNATNKSVTWSANNSNVSVSGGKVTAKTAGTAIVTVTTADGGYTAQCNVTVNASTEVDHTELASLSLDGNCYFDTEILPDEKTNTKARWNLQSGTTYIAGALDDNYKFGYTCTDNFYAVRGTRNSPAKPASYWNGDWIINQKGVSYQFGDTTVATDAIDSFKLSSPYYLGNMSKNSAPAGTGVVGKIYYAQIYSGDTLQADMIPVKKSDGTLCLYDKVRKKYIYNAGTGTLKEG